ncbi:hypothetical protein DDSR119_73 [Pseudomonas phage DDSR119]|nr:hypothetical protein DDSR119_73 [Pseudomonas phage DDSR119]
MGQTRFQYTYTAQPDAERNAKRHCVSHEWDTVIVRNPKDGRFTILMCDTEADLPTRVPILWRKRNDPPARYEPSDSERLAAILQMLEQQMISIVIQGGELVSADDLHQLCDDWIENGS